MYATSLDGDPHYWLEKLGGCSSIIQWQQIDGIQSAHEPLTEENNANGIIDGAEILKSRRVEVQEEKEKCI